jgi:hypothetical protein
MAIGSDPEIGMTFARWGDMDNAARAAWFRHIQTHWGADLLGGYATLIERNK